jgi:hypothetical protein
VTIKDIIDHAYTLSHVQIDAFKARRFIDEAMDRLSQLYDTACDKVTVSIYCNDINAEYSLPEDCIGVYKVTVDGRKFNCFLADNNYIKFEDTGVYQITYLKTPKLTDRDLYDKQLQEDTPSLNIAYHRVLPNYLAAQVLLIENPQDQRGLRYLSDFNTMAQDINSKLNKLKRKGARVKAPLWR